MKYFETLRIKGNVTFFTKVFYSFVAATTSSLITLTNPVTIVMITLTLSDFLGDEKLFANF